MSYQDTVFHTILSTIEQKYNIYPNGIGYDKMYYDISFEVTNNNPDKLKFEELEDYKKIEKIKNDHEKIISSFVSNDYKFKDSNMISRQYKIGFTKENAQKFFERLGIQKFGRKNPIDLIDALIRENENFSKTIFCCPLCKKYERSSYIFCCQDCRDTGGKEHDDSCNKKKCNEEERFKMLASSIDKKEETTLPKQTEIVNLLDIIQIIKFRKDNIENIIKK